MPRILAFTDYFLSVKFLWIEIDYWNEDIKREIT
jgi:hypothetical protein